MNDLIKAEVGIRDEANAYLNETFANYVEWLNKYLNCSEYLNLYSDARSLELIGEATFWSVNLGLASLIENMTYAEIRKFHPLEEQMGFTERGVTERSALIDQVCKKLKKPAMSFEASYALQQAAWVIYVHKNTYKTLKEQEALFESNKASKKAKI